jgi:hypothetical protein
MEKGWLLNIPDEMEGKDASVTDRHSLPSHPHPRTAPELTPPRALAISSMNDVLE